MPTGPDAPSEILRATGVLSKLLSAPVQTKTGFQVEFGGYGVGVQGFRVYKKAVDEKETRSY